MAEFYTVITDAGREAVARAMQAGEKVDITHFAVGDGGGVPVTPNESQTQLVNECWRGLMATYKQEGTSLIIDTYIPSDEESFTAREMGIFTSDGVLFAVANTPEMRKVLPSEGAVGNFTLGMVLDVTNIDMTYIEIHTNPELDFVKNSEKGVADGVASLDSSGKVPENQLPELDFIPNDEKGQPNGVMPLNSDGKADAKYFPQMDFYTKAETLANNTKNLFGLDVSAVPDTVFNKIKTLIDSANINANGKAKFQTGSYIGTGTYGDSNPTVINLNFTPKFFLVAGGYSNNFVRTMFDVNSEFGIWFEGVNSHKVANTPAYANFNVTGNTVKITSSGSSYQFNRKEDKYVYFAIG